VFFSFEWFSAALHRPALHINLLIRFTATSTWGCVHIAVTRFFLKEKSWVMAKGSRKEASGQPWTLTSASVNRASRESDNSLQAIQCFDCWTFAVQNAFPTVYFVSKTRIATTRFDPGSGLVRVAELLSLG
jgi:hypothetical protein